MTLQINPIRRKEILKTPFNAPLVAQVLRSYIANLHATGSKQQLSAAMLQGSGRKPWRQKGTGRARASSLRSILFRGGGVAFAANPKQIRYHKINKKMYAAAIKSMLSYCYQENNLLVVQDFGWDKFSTKALLQYFTPLEAKTLLVCRELPAALIAAAKNASNLLYPCTVAHLNPYLLSVKKKIIFTTSAWNAYVDSLDLS